MKIEAYLDQSPLFVVSRAARRFEIHLAQLLKEEQVSFLEALVLVSILFEEPKAVSPSRLAETFSTTRGNISHCVSSLEAKGMLLRKIDPQDARAFCLSLKPQGRKLGMQLIRTFDHLQKIFEKSAGISSMQAALGTIRKIEDSLDRMQK